MGANREVLVVGASAAGLRCACRLARLKPHWQVTVVDASPVFSYAACGLPYVLSGDIGDLSALHTTSYGAPRDQRYFAEEKGVSVLSGWRVTQVKIDEGQVRIEGPDGERSLTWDELVIATGARPRRLRHQPSHARVRTFHTWGDVEQIKQGLARGEISSVGIVGAGPLGCELAEAFRSLWGADVLVVESAPQPLPGVLDPELGALVARHMEAQGVEVLTDSRVERLHASGNQVTLHLGGNERRVDCVVVAVGVEPEVELARKAGVRLGETGAIAVNDRLGTNVPHVWAVGDCVEVRDATSGVALHRPLGSLANRQGRTLANILAGRLDAFPAVVGAMAVKAFDMQVASVGTSETAARARGLAVRSAWITVDDRAHYWPESKPIHLKMVYDPGSQRVLGVQGAGEGDVVHRIDVATQLILRGATLTDFAHLEHAYAPPFAAAVDPLAVLACVAQNQEDGIEADSPLVALVEVLDVRLPDERTQRPIAAATVHEVTLSGLRGNAEEGPTAIVVCERGGRAAETARLLHGAGHHTHYLGGGLSWRAAAMRKPTDARS